MNTTPNVIAYAQKIFEFTDAASAQHRKISSLENELSEARRKLRAICEERKKAVNALYEELKQHDMPAPFEADDELAPLLRVAEQTPKGY